MKLLNIIAVGFIGTALSTPTQLDSRTTSISDQLFADFRFYAQHVAAVYCNAEKKPDQQVTCANNGCPLLEHNNVTIIAGFTGVLTGIGGYVGVDKARKEIVLSIRGTTNFRNALTDIQFFTACDDVVPGGKVHAGFLNAWKEIADAARTFLANARNQYSDYKVVITGHSLGAGVATVAAAHLRRDLYQGTDLFTYGSPRVGNDVFADYVTNQSGSEYRITHYNDATPDVPFLFLGYRHAGTEYWLSTPGERKIDYEPKDVKICEGSANLRCSGSVIPSLLLTSHRYILADLYACGGLGAIS